MLLLCITPCIVLPWGSISVVRQVLLVVSCLVPTLNVYHLWFWTIFSKVASIKPPQTLKKTKKQLWCCVYCVLHIFPTCVVLLFCHLSCFPPILLPWLACFGASSSIFIPTTSSCLLTFPPTFHHFLSYPVLFLVCCAVCVQVFVLSYFFHHRECLINKL